MQASVQEGDVQEAAEPALTIVVIVHDDEVNLPVAMRSALGQTLRDLEVVVVDDASTDASYAVAQRFAAADARVRTFVLPENSGGCSRPRNTALGLARGRYVMFLDSDDEIERHACKSLLLAAERTGAELVTGRLVRENVATGKRSPWWPDLYRERRVVEGIAELPEQLADTTCTNKMYLRSFLDANDLRFPEGLYYEDLLFTTEAYCTAKRIAVEPVLVYRWKVREATQKASITNRLDDLKNLRDRLTIHRRIDAYLAEHGLSSLKHFKDVKFLKHDAWLYLRELPVLDDEVQREVVELLAGYVEDFGEQVMQESAPWHRMIRFFLVRRDLEHLRQVVDFHRHGRALTTDLVRRDSRVLWTDAYDHIPGADESLDIAELGVHLVPFEDLVLYHALSALTADGGRLRLAGTSVLPGGLPGDQEIGLTFHLRHRWSGRTWSTPLTDVTVSDRRLAWSADLDLERLVLVPRHKRKLFDTLLEVTVGQTSNTSPIAVDRRHPEVRELERNLVRVRAERAWFEGDHLRAYPTARGNLAFKQLHVSERAEQLASRARTLQRSKPATLSRRVLALRHGPGVKKAVYKRVLTRLPVRRGTVVFESHMGKQYSDSPRRIYEALRAAEPRRRLVWSFTGDSRPWPQEAVLVRRGSWRYLLELGRAQFWVDNQGFPPSYPKRASGTTYVQTWHGQPLKKMGYDEADIAKSARRRRALARAVRQWDAFCAPSGHTVRTLVKGLRYDGPLLPTGLPRNDPLVAQRGDPEAVRAAKQRLRLPLDKVVVLYAPTFRDARRRAKLPFELAIDLDEWVAGLGATHYLMVRCHYLDKFSLVRRFRPWVRDVSTHHDTTELLEAADVLVTDYSSILFDFAVTERPQAFFAYDLEAYAGDQRGTYLDLREVAPGPVVQTAQELVAVLADARALDEDHREARREFREAYCDLETGHAAESVVRDVLSAGRS